jgi:hypothetical protein
MIVQKFPTTMKKLEKLQKILLNVDAFKIIK